MRKEKITQMQKAHEVLYRFPFEIKELNKGYSDRTLRIDLDKNEITIHPVTQQMKDLWTGGKGFDLWLMLQEITKETRWDSRENPICFSSGPLGGTTSFPGSGKTIVTAISPLTHSIMDCNVGGFFGPFLKFAGFDALVIVGKAKEETIIFIDAVNKKITIERAPLESIDSHLLVEELTEMYADDDLDRRNISVVSAGRGAQHTRMGILNFSFWDWRRNVARLKQAGRGGIGSVFRNKKLKALVIKNRDITPAWRVKENKVAKWVAPKKISIQCKGEIAELDAIIKKWGNDPEFVIEMMQDIQDRFRHISKTALDQLLTKTGVPKAYLYHIATFYKAFSLEEKGETIIQVCMGTTCHVKGSAKILDSFERELGIKAGETSPDKKYTLEAVACLGACSIAPVVKMGEEVFGNVGAKDVPRLLKLEVSKGKKKEKKRVPITTEEIRGASQLTKENLKKLAETQNKEFSRYKGMLMVCTGTGCVSAKGFDILNKLKETLKEKNLDKEYLAVGTGCNGFCAAGPIVVVQPEGIFYQKLKEIDVEEIVESHLIAGKPVERLLHKDPVTGKINKTMKKIKFFSKQQLIALRNKGLVDPENIKHYIARGGYQSLRKVLEEKNPEGIIKEVIRSGIRGRGGGGFPAGVKWESGYKARKERNEAIYVVCNADEGDPGAYMDRSIIETDPHSVIEGMLIGAYAVGAANGYIYIRKEYPLATERLHKAINHARAFGLLGESILGSDFSFDIHVHRGAGAFVCGESTALMASMSGRAGEPRAKYVHNVEYGYRNKPTILNNVETWANIPVIIEKGAEWFASIGTGDVSKNPWNGSSGTKVFSLVGNIHNTGLVEVPMGITLREIIEDIGGGIPNNRSFKAVQTGGPSGGCIPASLLDMKVDFDSLTEAGSMMGSGGMIVMDDRTCMVDVARYFVEFLVDESCGKCTPCREGLYALANTLKRICSGEGKQGDIDFLEETSKTIIDASLCQLGGSAPNPVLSTLRYFREEYEEHIKEKKCRGGVCKSLITYSINQNCTGCRVCARQCPVEAISGEKKEIHKINLKKCIKCGVCYEVCKFNAVEVN
jgi:NADH:ubiquinone oxidoreductase subunit F (NADH-binding)/NADH:ubiquinone oxidoreductase subunit E